MAPSTSSVPPPAMWAQRKDCIHLTFNAECPDPKIEFTSKTLSFGGKCLPDKNSYDYVINLYAEIVPAKCIIINKGRYILVILHKVAVNAPFWPRLTTENVKHHWLKVDFGKMLEDNESDEEGGGKHNIEDMMRQMGGLDDMRDRPDFDDTESDSDDDAIPDLEE
ncbi:cytosolic prostaglandin E synthase [Arctopsyche grandis]|uniref:cytosolic prostaglandin E synthase n=1 Tax=Arctopsyche grandis TaxID=121162 RepID=UPI00406D8BDD